MSRSPSSVSLTASSYFSLTARHPTFGQASTIPGKKPGPEFVVVIGQAYDRLSLCRSSRPMNRSKHFQHTRRDQTKTPRFCLPNDFNEN
eukprot:scaffold28278_cov37-Prasinocladus_malaysianus.AAC.2